ncbi:prolyl aminopeptidase [Mycoplasma sp. Pen4]|uniref:prolyl aminopeptidase n=1 Tax=Mycoplasma sp. Pen4 TaxID=640330 RepID=UPI0016541F0E|nr:prolyl aminopeptidase [Mycoplasma sp. Pen4]QNM93353.1 prolyl aminopeptidase [Mycoplasma sp. Pen4]
MKLYNEIEPYVQDYLKVDSLHQIYYEVSGNPNGVPVFFIHGGPGGSTNPKCRRFFDPNYYKIILLDQRGCGKSLPTAELTNNTTWDLVEDIEKLRKHLNLNKIILFGGSWGTTLSLCYAIKYPQNVLHLVLRGIFLARQEDVDFLYEKGASFFYPEAFEKYANYIKGFPGNSILEKYYNVLIKRDENAYVAAKYFSEWESSLVSVHKPKPFKSDKIADYQIAIMESHYFINKSFLPEDNFILNNAHIIKDIPTHIVHGRCDVDTRPVGAYLLAKQLNNCKLNFVATAGHTQWDRYNQSKLISVMEEIKKLY